MVTAVQIWQS